MGDTCGSRASLSACIKTLESTLSALPAEGPFESTRLYLQKEIFEKKKDITESKASCKGAVDRDAAKRLVGLSRSSGTCDTRVSTSTSERARAGGELASPERQLSEPVSLDKSNAAQRGSNSLESLQPRTRSALQDMATSSVVQPKTTFFEKKRRHVLWMRQASGLVPHGASDRLCKETKKQRNTWTSKAHKRDAKERMKQRRARDPHHCGRLATTSNELGKALSSRSHLFIAGRPCRRCDAQAKTPVARTIAGRGRSRKPRAFIWMRHSLHK